MPKVLTDNLHISPSRVGKACVSAKYLKESVEDIRIRVPKGDKAKVQEHTASMGESTNAFVVRAITEAMNRDRQKQE